MRIALIALIISTVGACSLVSHDSERKTCAGKFDLNELKEPLGSSITLQEKMQSAMRAKQPVRLQEVTRAAEWIDDWDLMAQVRSNTPEAELNGFTQTAGYCWDGRPGTREPVPEGFYLFFRDHVPVQKVRWFGDSMPIKLMRGVSLTPQSQLVISYSQLVPA
ncbi:hypothetical protein [Nocardia sp. NPDC004722]